MKVFYDRDADLAHITGRKIAIAGYGSQGRAHALNLRDSGAENLRVALRENSASTPKAKADGLPVVSVSEAAKWADILMILTPDEGQAELYREQIAPHLGKGGGLFFAHGLNIHFQLIAPREDLDVAMIAPKGPGHTVRGEYERGGGVPCLMAVEQDASGKARETALAYASAIGGGKAGIIETSFRDECETDLFGEQAILCGGVTQMIHAAFETLTEAGYAPELAYFECLHELKLIVDLIYEGGISNMFYSVSNTAEYGAYVSGSKVVDARTRRKMRTILSEIQSGRFTRDWMLENQVGQTSFKTMRRRFEEHPIEEVGRNLRSMMPWIAERRLVDRKKN